MNMFVSKLIFLGMVVTSVISCGSDLSGVMMQGSGSTGKLTHETSGPTTTDPQKADFSEVMLRWNEIADGITIPGPVDGTVDFRWDDQMLFPHPTYKGGSWVAYETFSLIFVRFFDTGDNLQYLRDHGLLDERLVYIFPGGGVGIDTSFRQIADEFSAFGSLISSTLRAELGRIRDAM